MKYDNYISTAFWIIFICIGYLLGDNTQNAKRTDKWTSGFSGFTIVLLSIVTIILHALLVSLEVTKIKFQEIGFFVGMFIRIIKYLIFEKTKTNP